ncbi:MAG: hypothetical protein JWO02_2025, partial [Solirubrobacterales bacterium]|nr:hypothetical protein [Solirubrobacterales bacterium]
MRRHLTYANVTASLALFFALAGGSYAASKLPRNSVGATQLKTGAVTGRAIKNNSVSGADINESTLAKVPKAAQADNATSADRAKTATSADSAKTATSAKTADSASTATNATSAADADKLDGLDSSQLKLRCRAGTTEGFGLCFDPQGSDAKVTPDAARTACSDRGGRVPTWFELDGIRRRTGIRWANGDLSQYEWTSDIG